MGCYKDTPSCVTKRIGSGFELTGEPDTWTDDPTVSVPDPRCKQPKSGWIWILIDGEPIAGVLEQVREHLADCPCCTKQYKLVQKMLQAIEEA